LRVRERKHPKLYWVDPGLVRAVKKQLGSVTAEEKGPLVEGWILTLLRAYAQEREVYDDISYWAPAQSRGLEVDFLLQRGQELMAIKVKSSGRFSRSWIKGLKAVGELPRMARRVVVYAGSERLKTEDGIEAWPFDVFQRCLEQDKLWP
jgi:predicted AAA+ superfamily ATPase